MRRREKLLFVSSSGADKLNPMLEAFLSAPELKVEAVHYGQTHRFFDNGLAGLTARAAARALRLPKDVSYNRAILRRAARSKPDFVFVVKGLRVFPRTLKGLKDCLPGARLISWSQDDMFAPHNRNMRFTRGLKAYDLVVTQKSYNAAPDELPALGARNVLFQNKAFLPRIHRVYGAHEVAAPAHEVVFIGAAERDRFDLMNAAARAGIEIHIYGSGWDAPGIASSACSNLKIHNEILLDERYAAAISRSKIALCFLRKKNRDLQTSRTMEIPACGGFMLAEDTAEQRRLFEPDREAVYFSDAASMIALLRKYLADAPARRAIAVAGYARARSSGYSYQDRAKEILKTARRLRRLSSEPRAAAIITAPERPSARILSKTR